MSSAPSQIGELHLIPVSLGGDALDTIPAATLATVSRIDYFIVEKEKSARQFLRRATPDRALQSLELRRLDKDTPAVSLVALLEPALSGRRIGLLSEAGCPVIADPGAALVELAHRHGVRVIAHVGPSSVTLALMASGFNGQRFSFHGYLPVAAAECRTRLTALERESLQYDATQIFIETPYRNDALLQHIMAACRPATRLCVASDLTLPSESVVSQPIREWARRRLALGKRPSVFLLYAQKD
jgi:16S rRNA (cytidine1402-2'-O)-methyltransferase